MLNKFELGCNIIVLSKIASGTIANKNQHRDMSVNLNDRKYEHNTTKTCNAIPNKVASSIPWFL